MLKEDRFLHDLGDSDAGVSRGVCVHACMRVGVQREVIQPFFFFLIIFSVGCIINKVEINTDNIGQYCPHHTGNNFSLWQSNFTTHLPHHLPFKFCLCILSVFLSGLWSLHGFQSLFLSDLWDIIVNNVQ